MRITTSKLRADIYRILDAAIETGVPVEVVHKGVVLRIVRGKRASKLARLEKRAGFHGDADDVIGMNWLNEWNELDRGLRSRERVRPRRNMFFRF